MKRTLMTAAAACALTVVAGCASLGMDSGRRRRRGAEAATAAAPAAPRPPKAPPPSSPTPRPGSPPSARRPPASSGRAPPTSPTTPCGWRARSTPSTPSCRSSWPTAPRAFNDVEVPADVRRKLNLLRLGIVLPAPEPARRRRRTGRASPPGWTRPIRPASSTSRASQITLDDAEDLLADSRDPAETEGRCTKAGAPSRRS